MDLLVKQRRVRPSGQSKEKQEEFIGTGVRTPLRLSQQTDSFNEDNAEQGLYQRRLSGQVSEDNDSGDTEFAAAVAAVAFAIHSLEEDELEIQKKRREDLETSRNKIKSRKDDSSSAGRATRIFSNTEMKSAGTVSLNKSIGQEREAQERAFPTPNPSHTSSMRPTPSADRNQNQMRDSSRRNDVEAKADAWEKAEMTKIKKRYENMNSKILAWEDEKKTQAKFNMEKKKGELEQRSALNLRHYQEKIARIDQIAGGARQQLEEKRRNQVSKVEEKANKIRSTDKVSVKCFCFYCH
ncbi:hypothetical protein ACB092_04G132200 [Castanea dentata]